MHFYYLHILISVICFPLDINFIDSHGETSFHCIALSLLYTDLCQTKTRQINFSKSPLLKSLIELIILFRYLCTFLRLCFKFVLNLNHQEKFICFILVVKNLSSIITISSFSPVAYLWDLTTISLLLLPNHKLKLCTLSHMSTQLKSSQPTPSLKFQWSLRFLAIGVALAVYVFLFH